MTQIKEKREEIFSHEGAKGTKNIKKPKSWWLMFCFTTY